MSAENLLDITIPFVEKATAQGLPIQLLGGLASAAVSESSTTYSPSNFEIVTAERLEIPRLRDNGSPKDMDVQVNTLDKSVVAQVEAIAKETIGDQLDVNVFGLHTHDEIEEMKANPLSFGTSKAGVSDRYVVGDLTSRSEDTYFKAIFPFGAATPQSALETWYVVNRGEVHDVPIPVPHPAMMVLNNLTRSVAGMRKKYEEKIVTMTNNMGEQEQEFLEWMIDGPGQSQLELAGALRSLGWLGIIRKAPPIQLASYNNLSVSIEPPKPSSLREHSTYMLADAPEDVQRRVIALARVKSAILVGTVERHFQDTWERHDLERFFKKNVRNQK